MARAALVLIMLAACTAQPVGLPGTRNEALRTAAERHDLPLEWLTAIGYQQGRFELPDADMTAAPDAEDPAELLTDDTPLDDTGDAAVTDTNDGDDIAQPATYGVMYLSDDQVAHAATLTGNDADAIRTDIHANIDAAAALLADARDRNGDLRTATTDLLGLTDDAADAALADLDTVIADGFDLTTIDGEHLELAGAAPTTIEALAAGAYPARQFIASPNHSSRQGYGVRYIIIHDIEGTMGSAISIFKRSSSQVSAHYIVRAHDGHIVQMVYESQDAWHAGHGWFNRHSVGIEHEGFAFKTNGGGYYTDRQYQASARLACAIAHRYGIPVNRAHIFGHMNVPSNLASHTLCSDARGIAGKCGGVSHHADPGRYWNWTKYMHLVRTCVAAA
jgi:N-acetyl-anhydromuramyl-L-alanine amidase AmpD